MTDQTIVSTADFNTIKANLKAYLSAQPQFTGYNFEGSAMSMLLDVLSYNTAINAAHANLVFNETFLDTAVQRSSVVSRASEMGYVPRSKSAATATIQISFSVAGSPSQYVLPKGTTFRASINNESFVFTTDTDYIIDKEGSTYTQNIKLTQGQYTSYSYVLDNTVVQRLVIPSQDVDTSTLSVLCYDNQFSETPTLYKTLSEYNISDVDDNTPVYFLKEAYDGFFEVYFGDGIIGKSTFNGETITFQYLITDGAEANGANVFVLGSALSGVSGMNIVTVSPAAGGAEKETVESIKFTAPYFNASKGRAVTEDDYRSLVKNEYPIVDDVSVWGGEKNVPPVYGKVFLAIKPIGADFLTDSQKYAIQSDLDNKFNLVSITPVVTDPDYTKVGVNVTVLYNSKLYDPTSGINITNLVTASILDYFDSMTQKFGQPLYYSGLISAINSSTSLITSSILNLSLTKQLEIFAGSSNNYTYNFNNAVAPGSITSNQFNVNGFNWTVIDVPQGTSPHTTGLLTIYRISGDTTIYLSENAGTVDYATGQVILNNLKVDYITDTNDGDYLKIQASPGQIPDPANPQNVYVDNNVYVNSREQIVSLDTSNLVITVLPA